jgi:hypothetical protein
MFYYTRSHRIAKSGKFDLTGSDRNETNFKNFYFITLFLKTTFKGEIKLKHKYLILKLDNYKI